MTWYFCLSIVSGFLAGEWFAVYWLCHPVGVSKLSYVLVVEYVYVYQENAIQGLCPAFELECFSKRAECASFPKDMTF